MFLRSGKHIASEPPIAKKKRKCKIGTRNLIQLPQDCLIHVISLTTPRDACVSAAVSVTLRSVVYIGDIWQRFLPSDYIYLLSHAVESVQYASKKEIFFRLCDNPVPIYGGKMAFGLDKSSGAKCFTIAARAMIVSWIDGNTYWEWVHLSNSRFSEAAHFIEDSLSEPISFSGRIASTILSSETTYAAYLIYRLTESSVEITSASLLTSTVEKGSMNAHKGTVALHPECCFPRSLPRLRRDVKWSKGRTDGWREVKIGEFYIKSGDDEKVKVKLQDAPAHQIRGIIILGIEIRPS